MDKYEGLSEVIDRIINSDEIGVDDLLADSMAIIDGVNELLAEVKRLREMLNIAEQNIPRRVHLDCYIDALIEAGFGSLLRCIN